MIFHSSVLGLWEAVPGEHPRGHSETVQTEHREALLGNQTCNLPTVTPARRIYATVERPRCLCWTPRWSGPCSSAVHMACWDISEASEWEGKVEQHVPQWTWLTQVSQEHWGFDWRRSALQCVSPAHSLPSLLLTFKQKLMCVCVCVEGEVEGFNRIFCFKAVQKSDMRQNSI